MLTYSEFNYAQEGVISGIKNWWKKGVDAKRERILSEKAAEHHATAQNHLDEAHYHLQNGDHEKAAHHFKEGAHEERKALRYIGSDEDAYKEVEKHEEVAKRLEKGDIKGAHRVLHNEPNLADKGIDYTKNNPEKALASAGGMGALGGAAFMLMVTKGVPAFKKVYKAIKDKRMTAKEAKEELEKEGWLYRNGKWVAIGVGAAGTTAGVTGIYLERRHKK